MGQPIWDYSCHPCTQGRHDQCTNKTCYCATHDHFRKRPPRHRRRRWWQRRKQ